MKTLNLTLILLTIFILLLAGCIQAPTNIRRSSLASSATTTQAPAPTFSADETLYWFTTLKVPGTVTINKSSQDILYLRGKDIHNFLNSKDSMGIENYRKQFCLIGNFSTTAYKQLRVRAIPLFVTTSTKAVERLLRIDIPSAADNKTACQFSTIDLTIASLASFSLPEISSSNNGQITTTNLSLYEAKTSSLVKINSTLLDLTSALIKVDLSSNSTDPSSICTNSSCGAKGFDCCISGQCVKDASEKPNAKSDLQSYNQAQQDMAKNPLSFINYPNIYFICSNITHTPPGSSSTTTTPVSEAQARVTQYSNYYNCISDVAADNGYDRCYYQTLTKEPAYLAIKKALAIACGCSASDDQMATKCPDWGIVPVYKPGVPQSSSTITDFNCYTPVPTNPLGPITNLNVSVSNKSAPHRFYSNANINYDDISGMKVKSPGVLQEGLDFSYADEFNKIDPFNDSFNINSILGRMTIDLSHTLPAKMVSVEFGKTYILSATSGYFTPCTQCAKDSWFQTFSAHPNSQRGLGLQASGYTTSRDTYALNTTLGNYEDSKFGRACYVPVTMLPFSHQKNTDLQTQRQNRLKTQAAMYINGYQRDWYGFNLGALIASFDGVTWFAIGSGRRATATSTKLFLAINASFLDLADKTDTIVNIIPDSSSNTAADYDFDPDISMTDPKQNLGATCQKFHQCSVDADCVSQLGWEYVCADVSLNATTWPVFDSDAKEMVNQEKSSPLFEILSNTISKSNNKRCVYRGMGAPCKRDYNVSTINDALKKNLACAPNFYCAELGKATFNDELVRSPNDMGDILFGMEANVLGRPLNYVNANKSLTSEIIAAIKHNASSALQFSTNDSDDMGLCRPGRQLIADDVSAHKNQDISKRTDYISQIGSCDSSSIGVNRMITCPAFDDTLNYIASTDNTSSLLKQTQNTCGGESKYVKSGTTYNAFAGIEGATLLNLQNIVQPIFAKDACLRRAGSVCHTDLDCGPNKMHEDAAGALSVNSFGGTDAEQQYWRESLICGQGSPTPTLGTTGYFDYKLSENRCCREVGKDFTMFTQSSSSSIVPENTGTNLNLKTAQFSYLDPTAANRYSRYSVSKFALANLSAIPKVAPTTEPEANQWQVINETGSLTCCGGGWVRKFADGSHNWNVKNRLSLDPSNFSCLNFRSPLANSSFTDPMVPLASYQKEYAELCKSPDIGGCIQIPFQKTNNFTILSPLQYFPNLNANYDSELAIPAAGLSRLDTTPATDPIDGNTPWYYHLTSDTPYPPIPYSFAPYSLDINNKTGKSYPFFSDRTIDYGVEMYLPAYIGYDGGEFDTTFIKKVYIVYHSDPPLNNLVVDITDNHAPADECQGVVYAVGGFPIDHITHGNTWCIYKDAKTGNRPVMNVRADNTGNWKYAGIAIDFIPLENYKGIKVAEPGNSLYYLTKLGRLELIGIPQITYEPLYCNNNQDKLVPGIFKSTYATRGAFEAATNSYTSFNPISSYNEDGSPNVAEQSAGYGNYANKYSYQDKLDHQAIFSSKDFTCCTPLGQSTASTARCCSGFGTSTNNNKTFTCKLPRGTDLNVYFNKFVSNEGIKNGTLIAQDTDPDVIDFNKFTGEPKLRASTFKKLLDLGASYCANGKVDFGGAFGNFPPEPYAGSYTPQQSNSSKLESLFPMSIVDTILDSDSSDPNNGKIQFDSGYRWNHHYYCK